MEPLVIGEYGARLSVDRMCLCVRGEAEDRFEPRQFPHDPVFLLTHSEVLTLDAA